RRRHTRWPRDWSSDVCSSDLRRALPGDLDRRPQRPGAAVRTLRAGALKLHHAVQPPSTWSTWPVTSDAPGDARNTTAAATSLTSDRKSTRLNSSHVAISYAVF